MRPTLCWSLLLCVALVPLGYACSGAPVQTVNPDVAQAVKAPVAPVAEKRPKSLVTHGHERTDDYYWMRSDDRTDPDALAYLAAENDYVDAKFGHTQPLQDTLFEEMKGRVKKDDSDVPVLNRGYWYYRRYIEGGEYPIYCRKKGSLDAEEQVMLDGNAMGASSEYFSVDNYEVADNNVLLAWAEDRVGRRIDTIRFKNLETGEVLDDVLESTSGSLAWAADNKTLFYVQNDPVTLRASEVWRHVLGTPQSEDVLVYAETDESFYTYVGRSKSRENVSISLWATTQTEYRTVPADTPTADFQVFLPREDKHEYSILHKDDHFFVLTNWNALNFRLMKVDEKTTADKSTWTEVVPHRADVYLHDVEVFTDFLVLNERKDTLRQLRVMPLAGGEDHYIEFDEPVFTTWPTSNLSFDTSVLRFYYTSLTTPGSTYDYDMSTRTLTLMKRDEVVGEFDSANYVSELRWATARDGERVPVSMVRHKSTPLDGTAPLYVYAYGSYGLSMNAYFSGSLLSLLDRGFVHAVCHTRGGQELGRRWYEDGKLTNKINTFNDFLDCTEFLIDEKVGDPERVFAAGGSAGGLLMGAIINMRPDLYAGVVADVPFVDVVTTMLDESIPLTTNEFDEWGNPKDKVFYDYMLTYSPYDNVGALAYPPLLVLTGLHDSQVQYWEPAKWVAKLRAHSTSDALILFKTNMDAGHGGASGRFRRFSETALKYAFFLELAGHQE